MKRRVYPHEEMTSAQRQGLITQYLCALEEAELDDRYTDRRGSSRNRLAGMHSELEALRYAERLAEQPQDQALELARHILGGNIQCLARLAEMIREYFPPVATPEQAREVVAETGLAGEAANEPDAPAAPEAPAVDEPFRIDFGF